MSVALAWTLLAVCTLVAPGVFFCGASTPKLVALCAGAAVACWLAWRGAVAPGVLSDDEGRALVLLAAVSAFWVLLASVLAADPLLALLGTRVRRLGAPALLAAIALLVAGAGAFRLQPASRVPLLRGASGAACAAGVAALIQALLGQARAGSTFGDADVSAAMAACLFWLAAGGAAIDARGWRVLHLAGGAGAGAAVWLSGSSTGAFGLAAGLAVLVWHRARIPNWLAAGAVGLCVIAASAWRASGPEVEPLLWRDSISVVFRVPLFGAGPENFAPAFSAWQSPDLALAGLGVSFDSPQNMLLDFAVAGGFAAAALAVYALSKTVSWTRDGLAAGDRMAPFLACALAALVGGHVFVSLTIPALLLGALLAASVFASIPLEVSREAAAPQREPVLVRKRVRPGSSAHRRRRYGPGLREQLRNAVRAIAGGALRPLWVLGCASVLPVVAIATADGQSAALLRTGAEDRRAVYARLRVSVFAPLAPHFWYSRQVAARAANAAGEERVRLLDEAWRAGAAAARDPLEDLPEVANHLTALASERQDWKRALSLARQSVHLAPHWWEPRMRLAQLAWRQGRLAEAREQALQAVRFSQGESAAVRARVVELARSLE